MRFLTELSKRGASAAKNLFAESDAHFRMASRQLDDVEKTLQSGGRPLNKDLKQIQASFAAALKSNMQARQQIGIENPESAQQADTPAPSGIAPRQ